MQPIRNILSVRTGISVALLTAVACLPFFLASCDMFSTRNPEPPVAPRTDYIVATTPEILISNLKSSMKDKEEVNYLNCFADTTYSQKSFRFSYSAGSLSRYPFLSAWDINSERQYFRNLINAMGKEGVINLNMTNEDIRYYGDSATYYANYSLSVPFSQGSNPDYYQGIVRFTLLKDKRLQWVIYYWQDIKEEAFPSWSDLKGSLY